MTLSKTKKKGVERKKTLIDQLRAAADEFKAVYLFKYADMKNERMKQLRDDLKGDSRCAPAPAACRVRTNRRTS